MPVLDRIMLEDIFQPPAETGARTVRCDPSTSAKRFRTDCAGRRSEINSERTYGDAQRAGGAAQLEGNSSGTLFPS